MWLYLPFTDLRLRALGHEFVQIARAVIHAAVNLEKLLDHYLLEFGFWWSVIS
jgi:hypothetical protein